MPHLRFSERAEFDLLDIADFIGADNPEAARRFVTMLGDYCRLLEAHPFASRARDDLLPGSAVFPIGDT